MATPPLAMRIIASSILIANRAGFIIRDVMSNGELGIVEKVKLSNFHVACDTYIKISSSFDL